MSDPFAPISGSVKKQNSFRDSIVLPIPKTAPKPPLGHPTLGEASASWTYTNAAGERLGYVRRFDCNGKKEFRPLTLWRDAADAPVWRWQAWPGPRPLYGSKALHDKPTAPVLIAEGEKAADAAARLLPAFAVVTSPNGCQSARKADWSELRARDIVIWPDHDTAGFGYARDVAKLISAARIPGTTNTTRIIVPPPESDSGWDAADAESAGWTTHDVEALMRSAVAADYFETMYHRAQTPVVGDDADGEHGGRKRPLQRDTLIACADSIELWHDNNRNAYASFQVRGHVENWPLRSRDFRMWLAAQFYEKTGNGIGGQALEDTMRLFEARAINEGLEYRCFTRTGTADGKLYLDLGDQAWRAVEICSTGWRVIDRSPVKFLRSAATRALPEPEQGGQIEILRPFLNVDDTEFVLVLGWLLGAFRPRGPFPILFITGAQGNGKSFFTRMVRSLIDPSAAPIRAAPQNDRDLLVSAANSWVLAFDNLSSVPGWLSDTLCRLATGGGFATRMLHTDRDEMIFEAERPLILNGIPNLAERADLADRTITVHPRPLSEDVRRAQEDLEFPFEQSRPRILGALLDAVSGALQQLPTVKLDRLPRMADFARWATAAEISLGLAPGEFLSAYVDNRRDSSAAAFEADSIAVIIWELLRADLVDGFEGTATELLALVNAGASDGQRKSKYWPQSAAQFGNRLARAEPLLKTKGCQVVRRHSGERTITIVPPRAMASLDDEVPF